VIFPTIEGLGGPAVRRVDTGGARWAERRRKKLLSTGHRGRRSTRTETYPVSYYVLLLMSGIVPLLIYYALQVT
jgi:hypothetical protein